MAQNWKETDVNIILMEKGMVLLENGEPSFIKPRSLIITLPSGETITPIGIMIAMEQEYGPWPKED